MQSESLSGVLSVGRALAEARALGVDRLDAQLLLSHLLAQPRAWLLAHDGHVLDRGQSDALRAWLARRVGGEPLAYIVGETAFCGLALHLTPDVLVPRPETELLVEWALACLSQAQVSAPSVVDLGTGSGAVALALKQARPNINVCASDASSAALAVAARNAARHGLHIDFVQGDWWAPLAGSRFGLAVSNPPYIAGDDPHLAALTHEPRAALTPEGDGLAALRHIIRGAPAHLLPGAWLLVEHGHDQADAVQRLFTDAGFSLPQTRSDLAGLARCTGAAW